eukprot:gene2584-3337_t
MKDDPDPKMGYIYAASLGLAPFFGAIVFQNSLQKAYLLGMAIRGLAAALIYEKTFLLSNAARGEKSIGEIQNLMSNDAKSLGDTMMILPNLVSGPTMVILVIVLLVMLLGPSALMGLAILLCSFPITGVAFKHIGAARVQQSIEMDSRLKYLSEMIMGVRVLKYYAWERFFCGEVSDIRKREVLQLRKQNLLRATTTMTMVAIPMLITIGTFGVYAATGNEVTADVVFPALGLFNAVTFPLLMVPFSLIGVVTMLVACRRVGSFLQLCERVNSVKKSEPSPLSPSITFKSASFIWNEPSAENGEASATEEPAAALAVEGEEAVTKAALAPTPPSEIHTSLRVEEDHVALELKLPTGSAAEAGQPSPAAIQLPELKSLESAADVQAMDKVEAPAESQAAEEEKPADAEVEESKPAFRMQNVDLQVQPGSLVVVAGVVGSGKSSLLSAMVGEMSQQDGSVEVAGECALFSQVPWIMNATVRENIIFGRPFAATYYNQVVEACSLVPDFQQLAAGDQTEIGERGINLSGGQKARVALARAVYSRPNIILLDDPLAAVDAHVGRHLGMLKSTTRVLVTNALHVIPSADYIVVMKDGMVEEQGTYTELLQNNGELVELLASYGATQGEEGEEEVPEEIAQLIATRSGESLSEVCGRASAEMSRTSSGRASKSSEMVRKSVETARTSADITRKSADLQREGEDAKAPSSATKDGALTTEEERVEGVVETILYWRYVQAAGGLKFLFSVSATLVLGEVTKSLANFTLSIWSEETDSDDDARGWQWYLGAVALISTLSVILTVSRAVLLAYGATRAGVVSHKAGSYRPMNNSEVRAGPFSGVQGLVQAMFRAPMEFFDTTPTGRIVNRFSKDMDTIDTQLPQSLENCIFLLCQVVGTMILI